MPDINRIELLARLYDMIEFGTWSDVPSNAPYKCFGLPGESSNIIGKNLLEYHEILDHLYEFDKVIYQYVSKKAFESNLIQFVVENKKINQKITKQAVNSFFQEQRNKDINTFRVYRPIWGIALTQKASISVGNFKIFQIDSCRAEEFGELNEVYAEMMSSKESSEYYICYHVKAIDSDKALDIADLSFEKFFLFLRYIIGNSNEKFEVGILNFSGSKIRSAFVLCNNKVATKSCRYGSFEAIPLDDNYFTNSEYGYNHVWNLLDIINPTIFQKRIATAIEWVGKSLTERSIQTAFIQASTALESIFTLLEKSIVSPSILNQIAESSALILGNNYDERIQIEKDLKKLYSIRSGIVHSGKKDVAFEDYLLFIYYIRSIITILLTDEKYINCKTIESMYDKLKKCKYS